MIFSLQELFILFYIYSFIGWCVEVTFIAITLRKASNRGFLNGPICPIYGISMLGVLMLLIPVKHNLILLFLGGFIVCSAAELIGGWILDTIFHMRWWDYSNKKCNIGGYVCLRFSVMWGIAVVFAIRVIHKPIMIVVKQTPFLLKDILIIIFTLIFMIDLIVTLKNLIGIRKSLGQLDKLAEELHNIGDQLKDMVGNSAISMAERADDLTKERVLQRLEELEDRRDVLIESIQAKSKNIWNALPKLNRSGESIHIKDYIESIKKNRK